MKQSRLYVHIKNFGFDYVKCENLYMSILSERIENRMHVA